MDLGFIIFGSDTSIEHCTRGPVLELRLVPHVGARQWRSGILGRRRWRSLPACGVILPQVQVGVRRKLTGATSLTANRRGEGRTGLRAEPVQVAPTGAGVAQSGSEGNLIPSDRIYAWEAGEVADSAAQDRLAVAKDVPSHAHARVKVVFWGCVTVELGKPGPIWIVPPG